MGESWSHIPWHEGRSKDWDGRLVKGPWLLRPVSWRWFRIHSKWKVLLSKSDLRLWSLFFSGLLASMNLTPILYLFLADHCPSSFPLSTRTRLSQGCKLTIYSGLTHAVSIIPVAQNSLRPLTQCINGIRMHEFAMPFFQTWHTREMRVLVVSALTSVAASGLREAGPFKNFSHLYLSCSLTKIG